MLNKKFTCSVIVKMITYLMTRKNCYPFVSFYCCCCCSWIDCFDFECWIVVYYFVLNVWNDDWMRHFFGSNPQLRMRAMSRNDSSPLHFLHISSLYFSLSILEFFHNLFFCRISIVYVILVYIDDSYIWKYWCLRILLPNSRRRCSLSIVDNSLRGVLFSLLFRP